MFEFWHLALLFATGLAAGFVDSIAGGGGLITLPVMLSLGFPPQDSLGTNKLQATFGSASAAWHYTRAGTIAIGDCARGFFFALIGSALGTLVVSRLDPLMLERIIPILLIVIAIYVLLKPGLGAEDLQPRMRRGSFDVIFGLLLGFYDGFLGPGTGTFWAMAFMLGLGFNLTKATASTKMMNLASNLSSLAIFAAAGHVILVPGLSMGLGQLLGARLGSRMVIARGRKGFQFIRPLFICVVLAITVKLLVKAFRS